MEKFLSRDINMKVNGIVTAESHISQSDAVTQVVEQILASSPTVLGEKPLLLCLNWLVKFPNYALLLSEDILDHL